MQQNHAMANFVRGIHADLQDYQRLHSLLDTQFSLALQHDSIALEKLADEVMELVGTLNNRRVERSVLLARYIPVINNETVDKFLGSLPMESQEKIKALWQRLEDLIVECKEMNSRNCRLLTDQFEIMQRILKHEEHTYAPL
jgi:flagella synthesis protein FlgN